MTGQERIMAAFRGEKTDRPPMMLHSFIAAAAEAGLSMEEYRSSPQNIARSLIDFTRKYDLDGFYIDIDTCTEASAVGVPVVYPKDEPAIAVGAAGSDIEEVIDKMSVENLHKSERIKILVESVYLSAKEVGGELLVRGNCDQGPYSLAMLGYGMMDFLTDLVDEDCEEDLLRLIDRAYDVHRELHRMIMEAGADITSFGDGSCGPALISRECYRKFSYPFQKRLNDELKKENVFTICHMCGYQDLLLEDFKEIGFAGIELDQKSDYRKAKEIFKGHPILFGPIDPAVFYTGTPEDLARETREVLSTFSDGGIVIGAGCALGAGTPEENIRAFAETVKNWNR